jgi:hypothetical protein
MALLDEGMDVVSHEVEAGRSRPAKRLSVPWRLCSWSRARHVGHRINDLRTLPLVRKGGANPMQGAQKLVETQHPDGESENRQTGKQIVPLDLGHLEMLNIEIEKDRFDPKSS